MNNSSIELKPWFSKNTAEIIVLILLCRTWLRCRSGRDSGFCCPASSNASSAVKWKPRVSSSGKIWTTYQYYGSSKFYFTRKIPRVLISAHVNSFPSIHLGQSRFRLSSSVGLWGYQSYQVVPARVMNHPALLHHRGAPPLGVFDGLDHPHQRDVGASGGAANIKGGFFFYLVMIITITVTQSYDFINETLFRAQQVLPQTSLIRSEALFLCFT